jgi:hypothetical protein
MSKKRADGCCNADDQGFRFGEPYSQVAIPLDRAE